MPICEADPWRFQYFENVACPDDVRIPTEDGDAYQWYPRHRWVYNKLLIAESQGLEAAPHGIDPPAFPVFSKPIYNMRGMGPGSRVLRTAREYKAALRPGHMWMTLLRGEHVSTDLAIVDGEVKWLRHAIGLATGQGTFDSWIVEEAERPDIAAYARDWARRNLQGYAGILNIETIAGRIIEAHLRFADQWPDLYGRGWLEALVGLYAAGRWHLPDEDRRRGYSVVLFGAHGVRYRHPPAEVLAELRATPGVSSIQITFHEDRDPAAHSMPPGGFRLAIVNGPDLDVGRAVRERLAPYFWATQRARARRRTAAASGPALSKA
jgi:hypothetical protein